MAFGAGAQGGVRSEINITPLVDVVLVLLIIFMVMTPSLLKEMDLTVPDKADVQIAAPQTTDQVVVSVSASGQVALNHEPIALSALQGRIHEQMQARADKLVFFDIDEEANYGEAMHVMDLCRGAGAKVLGVMTK